MAKRSCCFAERWPQAAQLNRWDEPGRVSVDQLLDLVIEDYRSKGRHTTYDVEHRLAKHLRPFFGTRRPFEITLALLDQYVGSRAGNAAPATLNKELAYLRRAFRLGYRHEPQLVEAGPTIRRLPIKQKRNLPARRLRVGAAQLAARRKLKHQQTVESDTVLDKNGESQ